MSQFKIIFTTVVGAGILVLGLILGSGFFNPAYADDPFELSVGFNYNRTVYDASSYTWTRRWGASAGYHFSEFSEVEFAFTDVTDRNMLVGLEDTTFHDQIYSFNYIQNFSSRQFPIQPYAKIGIGQLNRTADGSYYGGGQPPRSVDSITGVWALGTRIYLTRRFAIRIEGTSYLTGGALKTWRDNFAFTFGTSISF